MVPDDLPLFMKPTASHLAKDRELGRIVDVNQKEEEDKEDNRITFDVYQEQEVHDRSHRLVDQ